MIEEIHKIFNNREIAIGLLFIILIVWILKDKKVRDSFWGVLKSFLALRKILIVMSLYICCIVFALYIFNFWELDLLKDTIYWFLGVALILFFNVNDIEKKANYFRDIIKDNFKVLLIVEFVSNFKSFNLVFEIISVIIIFFFSIVSAFTENDNTKKKENKMAQIVLSIYGVIAIGYSVIDIIRNFDDFATIYNLKSMLLSPIFTMLFIPFMYLLGMYMIYEILFVRIKHIHRNNKSLYRYVNRRILLKCNFSLRKIKLMSKELKIAMMNNKTEFKFAIREILTTGKQTINY